LKGSRGHSGAKRLYQQALPIHREIGDRLGEANALQGLGNVNIMKKRYAEAEELLLRAMGIFATINDKYSQGSANISLARLYRDSGEKQKAGLSARRAKELLSAFPNLVATCDEIIRGLS
jgi:tetratricopeptide (TPR) repeat protein